MSRSIIRRTVRPLGSALALLALLMLSALRVSPVPAAAAGHGAAPLSSVFDRQFIDMMVPHHMSAVAMAQIALVRAQHKEIKALARAIIAAQNQELSQMKSWRKAWYGSAATPPMGKMPMLPGMKMTMMDPMADITRLKTVTPFDRAFMDAMTPHHQMAIGAAKLELAQGTHPKLTALALSIIEDQAREEGLMKAYRELWYGSGGMGDMSGMG